MMDDRWVILVWYRNSDGTEDRDTHILPENMDKWGAVRVVASILGLVPKKKGVKTSIELVYGKVWIESEYEDEFKNMRTFGFLQNEYTIEGKWEI